MLCKHGKIEENINKRAAKGSNIMGLFVKLMKGKNVSIEVKRGLRNSILLPMFMYIRNLDVEWK